MSKGGERVWVTKDRVYVTLTGRLDSAIGRLVKLITTDHKEVLDLLPAKSHQVLKMSSSELGIRVSGTVNDLNAWFDLLTERFPSYRYERTTIDYVKEEIKSAT